MLVQGQNQSVSNKVIFQVDNGGVYTKEDKAHNRCSLHLLNRHHWHPSPPIPAHFATNSPTKHRRSTSFSPILIFNPIVSPPLPQREQQSTIKMSWSQSNNRACGGPRPSGNITSSAEGALPFKCARILSISPVVRHSLFNAAVRRLDDDLDLPGAALAGLDGAASGSIRMRPN